MIQSYNSSGSIYVFLKDMFNAFSTFICLYPFTYTYPWRSWNIFISKYFTTPIIFHIILFLSSRWLKSSSSSYIISSVDKRSKIGSSWCLHHHLPHNDNKKKKEARKKEKKKVLGSLMIPEIFHLWPRTKRKWRGVKNTEWSILGFWKIILGFLWAVEWEKDTQLIACFTVIQRRYTWEEQMTKV